MHTGTAAEGSLEMGVFLPSNAGEAVLAGCGLSNNLLRLVFGVPPEKNYQNKLQQDQQISGEEPHPKTLNTSKMLFRSGQLATEVWYDE